MTSTLYAVLDVRPEATESDIVRAYREKAKVHHPDVSDAADAAATFKRVRTAKAVLTDAEERRRYDALGHETYVRRYLDTERWEVSSDDGATATATATASNTPPTGTDGTAGGTARAASTDGGRTRANSGAAAYYRPGQRLGVEDTGGMADTLDAVVTVAPWLVAHALLLLSAGAVGALLLTTGGPPTLTTLIVAAVMVGITLCLSLLHVLSTLYR